MKKILSIPALLLALITGCTSGFEEINTNPNSPDKITNPGLLLPNVIRSAANDNLSNSFDRGSIAGDLLASAYASNFSNWVRADAPGYFCWNFYDYIRDLNEIIKVAEEQELNNYKGVALVLRSWLFQNLTDLYGPIPFREAANAKLLDISKPRYEQQQAVYAGLLSDLEEAVNLLGSSDETILGDILYNGNTAGWKKFASGLMLRLLLRQSDRAESSAAMKNIVENPAKYPLFQSNQEQAALQYLGDRVENESPFYRDSNSDYGISTRVSKRMVDYLLATHDSRLYVFALPAASGDAEYAGAVNGTGDWDDPARYSPPGMLWAPFQFNPDLASKVAAQSVILSYSEIQFILAEAAEKGLIDGGSAAAAAYYREGIEAQFSYYAGRIPDNYTFPRPEDVVPGAGYFQQTEIAYTGSAQEKLRKIWMQKWLALYLNGFEAWSEWRRTGFPDIQAGPVSPGYVPLRCLYPADEQRINEENYAEAVSWLGADDMKTRVWWDAE